MVATQDGGMVLALADWPPGSLLMVSRAKSQMTVLLEAGRDSERSGDSNTVAMSGRVDFQKKQHAYQ